MDAFSTAKITEQIQSLHPQIRAALGKIFSSPVTEAKGGLVELSNLANTNVQEVPTLIDVFHELMVEKDEQISSKILEAASNLLTECKSSEQFTSNLGTTGTKFLAQISSDWAKAYLAEASSNNPEITGAALDEARKLILAPLGVIGEVPADFTCYAWAIIKSIAGEDGAVPYGQVTKALGRLDYTAEQGPLINKLVHAILDNGRDSVGGSADGPSGILKLGNVLEKWKHNATLSTDPAVKLLWREIEKKVSLFKEFRSEQLRMLPQSNE